MRLPGGRCCGMVRILYPGIRQAVLAEATKSTHPQNGDDTSTGVASKAKFSGRAINVGIAVSDDLLRAGIATETGRSTGTNAAS